jgi:hypothetical protein
MSQTVSEGSAKPYGVERVCDVWEQARSTFYDRQERVQKLAQGISVEGGGKLRQLAARNCDTGSISDPLSIFLSIENLCFSASSSDWQRRRFFLPPGLAQTVALPVGLYDVTPVGQAV